MPNSDFFFLRFSFVLIYQHLSCLVDSLYNDLLLVSKGIAEDFERVSKGRRNSQKRGVGETIKLFKERLADSSGFIIFCL